MLCAHWLVSAQAGTENDSDENAEKDRKPSHGSDIPEGLSASQAASSERVRDIKVRTRALGFVSGHGLSRAVATGASTALAAVGSLSPGAKARVLWAYSGTAQAVP